MPIASNLGRFAAGSRLKLAAVSEANAASNGETKPGAGAGMLGGVIGAPAPAGAPSPSAQPAPASRPTTTFTPAALTMVSPALLGAIKQPFPPAIIEHPPSVFHHRTTTQLAHGAINQLNQVPPASLNEAINAIRNRNVRPENVMDFLEHTVRVGEVLGQNARDWADDTKRRFADAFQMQADRLDAMDAIVSVAILNDRDFENEIRAENMPQTAPGDLLQNRRVAWQWPEAGTVLTPPYLILIAVEYQDLTTADQALQSITGQLGTFQGFRLPKAAIQRL